MGFFEIKILEALNFRGILGQVFSGLYIVIFGAIALGLTLFILHISQYKHKFRIKEVINGRKIIKDDRAREFRDKHDKSWYWKLMKAKEKIPIPPPEAIEVDRKGRKCVEAYKLSTGEFVYSKDIVQFKEPPEEILNIEDPNKRKVKLEEWKKKYRDQKIVDSSQLLSTNQRLILINQIRKSEARRKKKITEVLPTIAAIAALTILVVAMMIFYEDMGKPLLAMGDKITQWNDQQTEQLRIMQEMQQNIQSIREDMDQEPQREAPG